VASFTTHARANVDMWVRTESAPPAPFLTQRSAIVLATYVPTLGSSFEATRHICSPGKRASESDNFYHACARERRHVGTDGVRAARPFPHSAQRCRAGNLGPNTGVEL